MTRYLQYWLSMIRYALSGPREYWVFLLTLFVVVLGGGVAYFEQVTVGLAVTNLSDQVSWGAYIANFTFLVGVAASAVLLVVPTYVFRRKDLKQVVLLGELLAVSAIVMCLAFVTVDIGRPDRILHMIPGFGRLNFPSSVLAWDVVVLGGYLALNLHIPGYLLYKRYLGEKPAKGRYLPLVFLSIFWAVAIHTVTAFLYSGLGGRPFWNSAILAPRFLVSAFAAGPALLIIMLSMARNSGAMAVEESVFAYLVRVMRIALPLNMFLFGCEVFKEFYTDSSHSLSAHYLFFGVQGHGMLVPYIWSGLAMGVVAMILLFTTGKPERTPGRLVAACALTFVGVWVEKGMGLIVPGFIPSPAGDLVEYTPSTHEILICAGIWALGTMLFTVLARVAIGIQEGHVRHRYGSQQSGLTD